MRNRFLNELVKEGVDRLGESWVGGSQLHVWIPEKPTETGSQPITFCRQKNMARLVQRSLGWGDNHANLSMTITECAAEDIHASLRSPKKHSVLMIIKYYYFNQHISSRHRLV